MIFLPYIFEGSTQLRKALKITTVDHPTVLSVTLNNASDYQTKRLTGYQTIGPIELTDYG